MQSSSSCKSFYLHEMSLITGSKYFRTLLETTVGGGLKTEMSTVGKLRTITILHDHIEEGEVEAVELVLKSFYNKGEPPLDTLPSAINVKVPLLLKALMVAERYQADECKEKIAKALSSIPSTGLTLEISKAVFALPAVILDLGAMRGIKARISIKFYQEIYLDNDVLGTINNPSMLAAFLDLPYSSVLKWIRRSSLKVHSENDVVFLLHKWIKIYEEDLSSSAIDSLIEKIRVVNLGFSYFSFILPSFDWFKKSTLSKSHCVAALVRENAATTDLAVGYYSMLPSSWLLAPRKTSGYTPPASIAFTFTLDGDRLKKLYQGKDVFSEPFYYNGYYLKGAIGSNRDRDSLFVGLSVYDDALVAKDAGLVVPLTFIASIDNVGEAPMKRKYRTAIFGSSSIRGRLIDFLDRKRPTMTEVVAPYLLDGKLTINFEVSDIDKAPNRLAIDISDEDEDEEDEGEENNEDDDSNDEDLDDSSDDDADDSGDDDDDDSSDEDDGDDDEEG